MDLKSRVALVTGGAVRIGRAICEALAARGCDVVIHYDRSAAEAMELGERLAGMGVRAFPVQQHLAEDADCKALIQAAKYGKQLGVREIWLVLFIETVDEKNRLLFETDYADSETGVIVHPVFVQTGKA